MARPEKWKDDFARVAGCAAKFGATDREIAEIIGVSERTLNYWKHERPELVEALKVGKEEADNRVEQSLYRRALGYSHDAVKIAVNGQGDVTQVPFVEHYPPDTTAAIFWLKNRKPDEWRDVNRTEHTGANGKDLVPVLNVTIARPETSS